MEADQFDPDELNQLVLISGKSTAGKSMSLRNLRDQERWYNFITEAGKRPPFRNKFNNVRVKDPYEVIDYMDELIANQAEVSGAILDTMTFWMDMMEIMYVMGSTNTQQAWGEYAMLPKTLLQTKVAAFGKPFLCLAHVKDTIDKDMNRVTAVPIKGSMANNGVEAYFSTVVMAKLMTIKDLEKYKDNGLLTFSEDELELGVKHVFQTRQTPETLGERIRSPYQMFSRDQTYMDNDAQLLLDHMHEFYNG